jgi:hypothetical protein
MIVLIMSIKNKEPGVVTTTETIANSAASSLIEATISVVGETLTKIVGIAPHSVTIKVEWAGESGEASQIHSFKNADHNLN